MSTTPPVGETTDVICTFESHRWAMTLEDGDAIFACVDPCPEEEREYLEGTKCCHVEWHHDDFHTPEPIPVRLTYVDDSVPSSPAGPAEHGFYIEVHPAALSVTEVEGAALVWESLDVGWEAESRKRVDRYYAIHRSRDVGDFNVTLNRWVIGSDGGIDDKEELADIAWTDSLEAAKDAAATYEASL